jgi:hypothetical protein
LWESGDASPHSKSEYAAGGRLQMVAVRKNLDLVWVWFYKDVAPTALFKGANPAKWHLTGKFYWQKLKC